MDETLSRRNFTTTFIVVWLVCVIGGLALPRTLTIFDFVEKWLGDVRVSTMSPQMDKRDDIVLLTITEDTLAQFPYRFPIDRSLLADVLEHLDASNVRAIGMDILFDQPTEPKKDQRLADVIAGLNAPVIVGWADKSDGMTDSQMQFIGSYLPHAKKAYANLVKGNRDGTVRWIFPGRTSDGEFSPGFAGAIASAAGGRVPDRETVSLLYRRGKDGNVVPFPVFPIDQARILPRQWFADKIVLIGADLPNDDRHRTPFATVLGNEAGAIPGVMIHALAVAQLLDGIGLNEAGLGFEAIVVMGAGALGVGLALIQTVVFVKVGLVLLALAAVWLLGFGVYALGGPLIPLFAPSVALAFATAISDIVTGRRLKAQKEHAELAARARSEFLAMMSHEIRTPMNGVLGVIELLKGSPLNAEQNKMVTIVQDSASALLGILNDILDFSKIEAGRLDIDLQPVGLRRLAEGVIATFAMAARNKEISLDLAIEDNLPDWLSSDPVRLRQILINLVGNAIKFTSKGGVRLICRRSQDDGGEQNLHLVVEDSGIGMSENALGRLFRPFTQADGSTTRRYGGTGLGLSISLRLVELMHGRIEVQSAEGKGSTFTVHLPLVEAEPPADGQDLALPELVIAPVGPSEALEIIDTGSATGPLILVAEDNRTNRWVIQQQLTKLGYRLHLTENGREALETYQAADTGHFAMILTDYHMPEMDGLDLARAVRRAETRDSERVPIVALTANAMPAIIDNCREAGIDDVLTKPTELSTLSQMLQRWVKADPEVTAAAVSVEKANGIGPVTDEEPVLDTAGFIELFGGVNDTVRAALAQYLSGGAELTELMAEQVNQGDFAGLAKTAHKLAGESLSAGAVALGRICKDLERAAMADDRERISHLQPQIGHAFGSVREAIAAL